MKTTVLPWYLINKLYINRTGKQKCILEYCRRTATVKRAWWWKDNTKLKLTGLVGKNGRWLPYASFMYLDRIELDGLN